MINRSSHRSEILAFLRQRKGACHKSLAGGAGHSITHARHKLIIIRRLEHDFDLIRSMNDWRQLREIYNHQEDIRLLLPSAEGSQSAVRYRILRLLEHSAMLASVPLYKQFNFQTKQYRQ